MGHSSVAMREVTDQMGRKVVVPQRPMRLISLVPSQTELLFDLGLEAEIVGLTKFCLHPAAKVAQKQRVGGTKDVRLDVVEQLQPDLILGNKEENERTNILALADNYPVWMSDIATLDEALAMIREVGQLTQKSDAANQLATQIAAAFNSLLPPSRSWRVGYFIWQKPFMVAGRETFIDDMLTRCGFINAFADTLRYPQVTAAEILAAELDAILLSSEPFPFREKHRQALADQFPHMAVYLVDGEMFSWYGSRLLRAVPYFRQLQEAF